MKKIIFIFLLLKEVAFSINYNIICPEDTSYNSESSEFGFEYFIEDGYAVGDWVDTYFFAWDSRSAVCGGDLQQNIYLVMGCDYNLEDSQTPIFTGSPGGYHFVKSIENGYFTNTVILVNHYPCIDLSNGLPNIVTHTAFDYDTNSLFSQYVGYPISDIYDTEIYNLDENQSKYYKSQCDDKVDIKEYVDALESQSQIQKNLIDNTDLNFNISSIFDDILIYINLKNDTENNLTNIDIPDLTDTTNLDNAMIDFKSEYESTLDNSFLQYSDVFGFGGYGSAPDTVSFELLGKSYDVFNSSMIDEHLNLFRNTLGMFAYFWGFLIVIKDFN